MRIYLDNCCYNRPYDDLTISNNGKEAAAKLFIQSLVKYGSLTLVYSFMSVAEVIDSKFTENKRQIMGYIESCAGIYVGSNNQSNIELSVKEIMHTGIKNKDAIHLACAIYADCGYFITTDKRVLNYKSRKLKIVNPIDFVTIWRETL